MEFLELSMKKEKWKIPIDYDKLIQAVYIEKRAKQQ